MHFTHLRLAGFKSFVDPTDIPIEPGLTGIVGPNGCGKSNLVEAMRWVMGENSHKSLRGTAMEDVIFAGSGARPARNTAEVALRVDNAERQAPAEFNSDEMLEVSRRIERGAGSSYRVNGRDVRARDVQLLFADASSGAHSVAMVRQGQIGELIAAKPKDRRRILEDAAGIAGLYQRRHEAELRLRGAEQNLERLDDVLIQIMGQLDSLRKQAKQAAKYRQISAEIRKLEAAVLYARWSDLRNDAAKQQSVLDEAVRAVAAAASAVAEVETQRTTAQAALPDLRSEEARAAAVLRHLELKREQLKQDAAQADMRAQELEGRINQMEQDRAREATAIADTAETLQRLAGERADLIAQVEDADHSSETLAEQEADAQAELSRQEETLSARNLQLAEADATRASLIRRKQEQSDRLAGLERTLEGIRKETESLQSAQSEVATAPLEQARAALNKADGALTQCEAEAEAAQTALQNARDAQSTARTPLNEAQQTLRALQSERETLQKVLAGLAPDLFSLLVDQTSVTSGYETALGAALGDDLETPEDEGAPVFWRRTSSTGDPSLPEGVESLASHVRAPAVLTRRLNQIGLVSEEDGSRLQGQLKPGQRLVSPSGALWRWDGYTARADAPTAAARKLEQRNRLAEIETESTEAETRVASAQQQLDEASQSVQRLTEESNAAGQAVRDARQEQSSARDQLAEVERNADRTTARLAALKDNTTRLTDEASELRDSLAGTEQELAGLTDVSGIRAEAETFSQTVAVARAAFAEARATAQTHRSDIDLKRRRIEAIDAETQRWTTRAQDAEKQSTLLGERLEALRQERAETLKVPSEITEKTRGLENQIEEAETARKAAADALAEGETRLREAETAVRAKEQAQGQVREDQARAQATLEGVQQRLADTVAHITETLECAPEALQAMADIGPGEDVPDPRGIERDLDRLKRERDRIGPVNLRAETEAEEAQAEHDRLQAEKTDLENAIAKLRTGIGNLNREGRQRLLDAFEKVNQSFKQLFTTLFGGGQAELMLTESDDPLEAGLDIIARPPGKKAQSLTLLSGGEKALTATALIFAVFITNPSPICVLDEVDAPLDDANVERFCALMEEMSRSTTTRFLLITHNPITMARMDRLFGVTMVERGVSQVVSVDLMAAERLRQTA
ncbi:MAG: chromosome segregation protein SMC [Pseudomonadota bacterium]